VAQSVTKKIVRKQTRCESCFLAESGLTLRPLAAWNTLVSGIMVKTNQQFVANGQKSISMRVGFHVRPSCTEQTRGTQTDSKLNNTQHLLNDKPMRLLAWQNSTRDSSFLRVCLLTAELAQTAYLQRSAASSEVLSRS